MRPSPDPLVTHVLHMMTDGLAITKSDVVIVAVSGGLDSLVLLHILASQHDRWPFGLHVATFDHGWRAESATDAAFVQGMAAAWGLPCTIGRMPPPDHMPQGREAAARTARYAFLVQVARDQGAHTIVTAHHADDQTETILLHLLRGTGTHGLQGMSPHAPLPGYDDIWLARPLLEITREQLATYAQTHNLTPRQDSSNNDPRYQRNALRQEIVPQLKRFNLKFTHNLLRLASIVRDEQAYLDQELRRGLLHDTVSTTQRWTIEKHRFWQEHIALQKRYIWKAAQALSETPQDVTYERIMAAVMMIRKKQSGLVIEIAGGVLVRLTHTHVVVEHRDAPPLEWNGPLLEKSRVIPVVVPGQTRASQDWVLEINANNDKLEGAMFGDTDSRSLMLRVPEGVPVTLCTYHNLLSPLTAKSRKGVLDAIERLRIPTEFRSFIPVLMVGQEVTALFDGQVWTSFGEHAAWNVVQHKDRGVLYVCTWQRSYQVND